MGGVQSQANSNIDELNRNVYFKAAHTTGNGEKIGVCLLELEPYDKPEYYKVMSIRDHFVDLSKYISTCKVLENIFLDDTFMTNIDNLYNEIKNCKIQGEVLTDNYVGIILENKLIILSQEAKYLDQYIHFDIQKNKVTRRESLKRSTRSWEK
jgi:hypothetical protein